MSPDKPDRVRRLYFLVIYLVLGLDAYLLFIFFILPSVSDYTGDVQMYGSGYMDVTQKSYIPTYGGGEFLLSCVQYRYRLETPAWLRAMGVMKKSDVAPLHNSTLLYERGESSACPELMKYFPENNLDSLDGRTFLRLYGGSPQYSDEDQVQAP